MTICIGILATGGKSIVCLADKSVTYNEEIQGDVDSAKIVPVGANGCHALISGNETTIGRILTKLGNRSDIGKSIEATRSACEKAWKEAEGEILQATFLHPFLTAEKYNEALLKDRVNPVLRTIAANIEKARAEQNHVSCGMILCGFDSQKNSYILGLGAPGLCTDMTHTGFHSVGSGSGYALQKLVSVEWDRSRSIDHTLYECFDAKVSAENDPNVGYDWDALVLTKEGANAVPKEIKTLVDRAWTKNTRSPYARPWNQDEDIPLPPDDWKTLLKQYADGLMPSDSQTSGGRQ
jgi:hypothetical protein